MILLRKFSLSKTILKRTFSSALYITGDKAHEVFAVLTPVLDFEERLKDRLELEDNLKLRRLNVNLDKLENRWNYFKHLDEQRIILEVSKVEISKEIIRLKNNESKSSEKDIEKLKLHGRLVKDDLRILKEYLYGVEESAALGSLSIPNILDKKTPCEGESFLYSFLDRSLGLSSKSHLDVAGGSNLIEYTNPLFYFLKGEAALFELAFNNYVSKILLDSSFIQFSNPDFCRSVIIEGCSTDFFNKLQVFTLEKIHNDSQHHHNLSRLHLVGGASLYSFMAYFARHSVKSSYFPLRLFAPGRQYHPVDVNLSSTKLGLFNVSQETAMEVFIATEDDDKELENEFQNLVSKIIQIYEPLGHHFRLVYLPAHKLKNHESLRLSIQMFSCYLQEYIEVGHCSVCDSYLSKRLLFTYPFNKEWKYPKVISSTLFRFQPLLACMLEYNDANNSKNLFPPVLNK